MISHLEEFALQNKMPNKTLENVQHNFEEFVMQAMLPYLPISSMDNEKSCITLTVEYSEENENCKMFFYYTDEQMNPLERLDDISKKLVQKAIKACESYFKDERFCLEVEVADE